MEQRSSANRPAPRAIGEVLEAMLGRWEPILGECPICSERHWWEFHRRFALVSCQSTEAVHSADELPADVAARLAYRVGGRQPAA